MIGNNNGGFGFQGNPYTQNNQNFLPNNQFGNQVMNQNDGYGYGMNNMGYQQMNNQYNNGMQQNNFFNTTTNNQENIPVQNNFIPTQDQQNNFYNNNFQQDNTFQYSNNNNGFNNQNQYNNTTQGNEQGGDGSSPYTDFSALPNYGENVNVNTVVDQIKVYFEDKQNWKSVFDAIDNLRILNKYYPNEINDIAGVFWKYITNCLESQKTPILKNILIFIKEMISHTAKEVRLHDDLISGVIPFILKLVNSEKKLIKQEVEVIMEEFITNCCFDASVVALCKSCFDKNPSTTEISFLYLAKMIANIGENLPKLQFGSLECLMVTLGKILDSAKKGNMKKWATELCVNTCKLFGIENYYQLIQSTLGNQLDLAQHLVKAVEDKKDPKRESGFHNFVQEQKMKVRMSQFGGNMGQQNIGNDMYSQQKMNPQTILGQSMNNNNNMNNGGYYNENNYQMNNNMGGYNNGYSLNFPQNY